jgi:hypothetical protein
MKKGLQPLTIHGAEYHAERRHIDEIAALIHALTGCGPDEAVSDAFKIAQLVDARLCEEIEEAEKEIKQGTAATAAERDV